MKIVQSSHSGKLPYNAEVTIQYYLFVCFIALMIIKFCILNKLKIILYRNFFKFSTNLMYLKPAMASLAIIYLNPPWPRPQNPRVTPTFPPPCGYAPLYSEVFIQVNFQPTVWCNQMGTGFSEMSSRAALTYNLGMKNAFEAINIKSKYFGNLIMKILNFQSLEFFWGKCILKEIQRIITRNSWNWGLVLLLSYYAFSKNVKKY